MRGVAIDPTGGRWCPRRRRHLRPAQDLRRHQLDRAKTPAEQAASVWPGSTIISDALAPAAAHCRGHAAAADRAVAGPQVPLDGGRGRPGDGLSVQPATPPAGGSFVLSVTGEGTPRAPVTLRNLDRGTWRGRTAAPPAPSRSGSRSRRATGWSCCATTRATPTSPSPGRASPSSPSTASTATTTHRRRDRLLHRYEQGPRALRPAGVRHQHRATRPRRAVGPGAHRAPAVGARPGGLPRSADAQQHGHRARQPSSGLLQLRLVRRHQQRRQPRSAANGAAAGPRGVRLGAGHPRQAGCWSTRRRRTNMVYTARIPLPSPSHCSVDRNARRPTSRPSAASCWGRPRPPATLQLVTPTATAATTSSRGWRCRASPLAGAAGARAGMAFAAACARRR